MEALSSRDWNTDFVSRSLILRIGIMFVGGLGGLLVRVMGSVGDYYLGSLGVSGLGGDLLEGGTYSYAGLCKRTRIGSGG